ncbi:DNA polymerase zeta [Coemansia sp. RSA 485]|nr:DNA polymerase zeta [Coemansia sp. RSA 485]
MVSEQAENAFVEVQLTNIDSCTTAPTSVDCRIRAPYNIFAEPLAQVPVIRIFGATKANQRICLHVHQVWPYLCVQYKGSQSIESVREYGYHLGLSLNHALNISLRSSSVVYVAAVIPIKGVPFYGYYAGYQPFFKVLLTNPTVVARASSLLSSGAVMGRRMHVFGSHMSYLTQFLVDYNLYGMDWIRVRKALFRTPLPVVESEEHLPSGIFSDDSVENIDRWVPQGMPSYLVKPEPPRRTTHCELEADVISEDILNRNSVEERYVHHVFQEGQLGLHFGQLVHSLNTVWADENQRRRENGLEELQPRNSQDQAALEELLTSNPADISKHSSNASERIHKWPNHWRMQSLLQSALLIDKQNLAASAVSDRVFSETDAFNAVTDAINRNNQLLDAWPTCLQVDRCGEKLFHSGINSTSHFYLDTNRGVISLQTSGMVEHISPCAENAGFGVPQSVCSEIVVDLSAIDVVSNLDNCGNAEGAQLDTNSMIRSGIGHLSKLNADDSGSDVGSRYRGFESVSDDDESGVFDDMDNSWIEGQIKEVEQMHTKARRRGMDQIDGTEDSDDSVFSGREGATRQQRRQPLTRNRRKSKRRALVPLNLRSSSLSSGAETSVALRSKECPAQLDGPAILKQKYSSGFEKADLAFNKALSRNSRRTASTKPFPERVTWAADDTDMIAETCEPNTTSSMPKRARVYAKEDIYVDIDNAPNITVGEITRFYKAPRDPRLLPEPYVEIDDMCVTDITSRFSKKEVVSRSNYISPRDNAACCHRCPARLDYSSRFHRFSAPAPTVSMLFKTLDKYDVPEIVAPMPHFSNAKDLPQKLKMYSGVSIKIPLPSVESTPVFNPEYLAHSAAQAFSIGELGTLVAAQLARRQVMWNSLATQNTSSELSTSGKSSGIANDWRSGWWEFAKRPPAPSHLVTMDEIRSSQAARADAVSTPARQRQRDQSDIKWSSVLGVASTPLSTVDSTSCQLQSKSLLSTQSLRSKSMLIFSQMSLEVLTDCKQDMSPDPHTDCVLCVVTCFSKGTHYSGDVRQHPKIQVVVWTWGPEAQSSRLGLSSGIEQRNFADEQSLINDLAQWTCKVDPDILSGYEVQSSSWGFLIQRTQAIYERRLDIQLGRVISSYQFSHWGANNGQEQSKAEWGRRKSSGFKIAGRHVLNIWRLMRSELNLTSYTFQSIVWQVLKERCPHFSPSNLALWFKNGSVVSRIRAVRHMLYQAKTCLRILAQTDIVTRASEMARVIGIDLDSVFTRGSQLRVESLMARIAGPEQYLLLSPTREQVSRQRAAECLPLVLEPQSKYYTDPVVVLDFQSLYPSIMIAFNICYSTCLGSLEEAASPLGSAETRCADQRRLGFTSIDMPPGMLTALKDHVNISPNGIVFVKPSVRRGLLGRMLQELLESRVMLKEAMKRWGSEDAELGKKLDAWQMGLKLIANVTYGYTGASFSGRMPCVDIADAIVQCGREMLESTIRFIHSKHTVWGARVVYGDTDSVFIHLPGKSRESAFQLGKEIAEAVTERSPAPIKLKFEKVYQPCVLLTKKRYAGWMFTSVDQKEPLLDVKGMELVRRDGCKATQRILEGTMDILFKTNDLSLVKSFVIAEISKVVRGDQPLQEFIIAKEVRMGTYSGRNLPAHAKVAADNMLNNTCAEPQYGERVPYVVVSKSRHSRLTDQVVRPQILLQQPDLCLDYQYYVDKQILPALDRFLSLIGVDVCVWVADMPRRLRSSLYNAVVEVYSDSEGDIDAEDNPNGKKSSDQVTGGQLDDLMCQQNHYYSGALSGSNNKHNPPIGDGRQAQLAFGRQHNRRTLDHFYHKRSCLLCRQAMPAVSQSPGRLGGSKAKRARICNNCFSNKTSFAANTGAVHKSLAHSLKSVLDKCADCVGENRADALHAAESCLSLDCPNMFQRVTLGRQHVAWNRATMYIHEPGTQ